MTALRSYLEQRGHLISIEDLAAFALLASSRGWVILAGPSGTGKSSLVRLLAEAFRGEFVDIQVKRHWTNSEEVLGYYSETARQWVPGPLYVALIAASASDRLQFVRLDEMNLAPPEYYVAELLSAGESWHDVDGVVTSAPIQLPPIPPEQAPEQPRLTNRTLLFGTLNIDETTQALSPKMLDRSAVVTFEQVDLASIPMQTQSSVPPKLPRLNAMLAERPRSLGMLGERLDESMLETLTPLLTAIDSYTAPLGYPLPYRQRDGLLIALCLWKDADFQEILKMEAVIDSGIRSMILPKLQGSALGMAQYLRGLAGLLVGDEAPLEGDLDVLRDRLATAKYPRSLEKVISMLEQLSVLGYFNYW